MDGMRIRVPASPRPVKPHNTPYTHHKDLHVHLPGTLHLPAGIAEYVHRSHGFVAHTEFSPTAAHACSQNVCVWVMFGLCLGYVWVMFGLCLGYVSFATNFRA